MRCEDLRSSSGPVVDLSLSGARITHRGLRKFEPGEIIHLDLQGYGTRITVPARIARTNRIGFMHAEVGVEFINLDEQMRQILAELVRCHSVRYCIFKKAA